MTGALVQTQSLNGVRPALETRRALAKLDGEYPYFVHKWTKQKRHYTRDDLALPDAIFLRGNWPDWGRLIIGVGGTRSPLVETFCLVAEVIRELAKRNVVVISGGVPGVDLAAHLAAADSRVAATVAVLANPVDLGLRGHEWSISFAEAQMLRRGAFLSEYSEVCGVGSDVFCERLLARDRIISGLCDVFLVFECNEDSATIDTAHRALLQGKCVICIESVRKSIRRGIEQLAGQFSVPVLEERRLIHAASIANKILQLASPALERMALPK